MVKKQNVFKNLLASSAIASVVASLGSSNVALAVRADRGALMGNNDATLNDDAAANTWSHINQDGTVEDPNYDMAAAQNAVVADRPAITYSANKTLYANRLNAVITAINLADHRRGILTVNENVSIGSIVKDSVNEGGLSITIAAGHQVTLTGTSAVKVNHGFLAAANRYSGLRDITLGGRDATLVVHTDGVQSIFINGAVTTNTNLEGILTFAVSGRAFKNIGAVDLALATVNIGDKVLLHNVYAANTNLTHANSVLNLAMNKTINSQFCIITKL